MEQEYFVKQLRHIEELLDHPAIDQSDIYRRVEKVFREAKYFRHPYEFRFEAVYRAASKEQETWFDNEDGRTVNVGKLHCPPDEKAILGRCNCAGNPVFYCSSENGIPVFEVRATLNSSVVLSTWVDIKNSDYQLDQIANYGKAAYPIIIQGVAIGVKKIIDSLPDGHQFKQLLLQDDLFKSTTPESIRKIDEYVGELFCKSADDVKNLYWFTSAIAQILLGKMRDSNSTNGLDGFIYPSVQSKFSDFNIAFRKEFARRQLKLLGAAMYRVVEHDPEKLSYSLKPIKGIVNDPLDDSPVWKYVHSKHSELFLLAPDVPLVDEIAYLSYED